MTTKWKVRYHRTITDAAGKVIHQSGEVLDSIGHIPAGQHDRLIVFDDGDQPTVPPEPEPEASHAQPPRTETRGGWGRKRETD